MDGLAQFLLTPIAAPATINGNPNPNGYSYSGGSQSVTASNINKTYDEKKYLAFYFQDDWKMTPKMTLNLGRPLGLLRSDQRDQRRAGKLRSRPRCPRMELAIQRSSFPPAEKTIGRCRQTPPVPDRHASAWSIFWRRMASPWT